MGKKKSAKKASKGISKTAAIKAVLAKGMDKPVEVAKEVKTKFKLDVTANYVSMVKSDLKKKAGAQKKKKAGPPMRRPTAQSPLDQAIHFVEGVGSLEEAKALLEKMELIRKL